MNLQPRPPSFLLPIAVAALLLFSLRSSAETTNRDEGLIERAQNAFVLAKQAWTGVAKRIEVAGIAIEAEKRKRARYRHARAIALAKKASRDAVICTLPGRRPNASPKKCAKSKDPLCGL